MFQWTWSIQRPSYPSRDFVETWMGILVTYCVNPSAKGFVISIWKLVGPSIKVIGAVKSQGPVADADALHPRRYVVSPLVT
jgi:hypothetical protein